MSLDAIKTSVDQIGRNFEEFKATVDKSRKEQDVLIDEKIKKLADDITAKHEFVAKGLDDLEAKLQRPNHEKSEKKGDSDDAELFRKHWTSAKGEYASKSAAPDADATARYSKAFSRYLRGDEKMLGPEER